MTRREDFEGALVSSPEEDRLPRADSPQSGSIEQGRGAVRDDIRTIRCLDDACEGEKEMAQRPVLQGEDKPTKRMQHREDAED
jgi:hypothetical protein